MYGPPADPSTQVAALPWDQPLAWVVTAAVAAVLLGLAWTVRKSPLPAVLIAVVGEVLLLTAPALGMLRTAVWGAYPTIDKEGSQLFFADGVHLRMVTDPGGFLADPAAKLIGAHLGHLWVAQLFALVLPTFGAFGAESLLWLILAGICAAWFSWELTGNAAVSGVVAVPFAVGLHLMADVNWYTVEKTAVFVLPLAGVFLLRAAKGSPWAWAGTVGTAFLAASTNLYLAAALLAAAAVVAAIWAVARPSRTAWVALAALPLGVLPIAVLQALLMRGAGGPSPECYLTARATQDVLSVWPPTWERLEVWIALDPLVLVAAGVTVFALRHDRRVWALLAVIVALVPLALGPDVLGLPNPVYRALWTVLPFFWRIAKPEVFLFPAQVALVGLAAIGLSHWNPSWRVLLGVHIAWVVLWLLVVRTHPAYPGFSHYRERKLDPDWIERFQQVPPMCRTP